MTLIYEYTGPKKSLFMLTSFSKDINVVNSSLDACIKGSSIDTNLTIDTLTKNINSLKKIKTSLSSTILTDDNASTIFTKISSSIDSTQNLYIYCINSLTDSENFSYTVASSEIDLLRNQCLQNYNDVASLGISLKFSKDSNTFFTNMDSYLKTLEKSTKYKQVQDLQKTKFFKSLNNSLTEFSKLLEDLQPVINKVRSDKRSFDVLIDDISNKELQFLIIKRNFDYISIPVDCKTYYDNLIDTFNIYSIYLTTIKTALIYEKSASNYDKNKKVIDDNYSNAYSKYQDVTKSLDSLIKALENL